VHQKLSLEAKVESEEEIRFLDGGVSGFSAVELEHDVECSDPGSQQPAWDRFQYRFPDIDAGDFGIVGDANCTLFLADGVRGEAGSARKAGVNRRLAIFA
jgi:hypothetical protein